VQITAGPAGAATHIIASLLPHQKSTKCYLSAFAVLSLYQGGWCEVMGLGSNQAGASRLMEPVVARAQALGARWLFHIRNAELESHFLSGATNFRKASSSEEEEIVRATRLDDGSFKGQFEVLDVSPATVNAGQAVGGSGSAPLQTDGGAAPPTQQPLPPPSKEQDTAKEVSMQTLIYHCLHKFALIIV
jgi:hypothetical protein